MSRYGLETNIRSQVTFVITIISMLLGSIFYPILNNLFMQCALKYYWFELFYNKVEYLGFFSSTISVLLFYRIFAWLFNNHLWKTKFFEKRTKVPDLSGIWEGTLESSYITNGDKTKIDMRLDITQTWTEMVCNSKFKTSESSSDLIFFDTRDYTKKQLFFTYANNSHNLDCHLEHYLGYNKFVINELHNEMIGRYYTNRLNKQNSNSHETTYGIISLSKIR